VSLTNLLNLSAGFIELYSVETAVLFYIKNGFIVRDLWVKNNPQTKAAATQKMIRFAMDENNIEFIKEYAKVNKDNFIEFVEYLLRISKFGKFFKAYFDALDEKSVIEESVMKSRFIASVFNTDMLWPYVREVSNKKINLKPLTTF